MVQLLSLAAVAVALAVSPADRKARAPVPKPPEVPAIEGTYTLNYTSVMNAGGWGGGGWAGGPGMGGPGVRNQVNQIVLLTSTATISKSAIAIGGADAGFGYGPGGGFVRGGNAAGQTAMTYAINPATTPMSIDIHAVDARNKKTKALGIVEVIDDRVTVALAKPGADRPKSMDETEEVTVYYFKKAPPPPKTEFRIVAMAVGKEADAEKELNRLAEDGFELVTTTNPAAADPKAAPTTVHFVLKRIGKP
jgi:hypothetical protein